jgi:hypothetical protein
VAGAVQWPTDAASLRLYRTTVRLYRTTEGGIGCQLDVAVTAGDRKRLANAFEAVPKVLAEKRAR